jgi:aminomuconate-semialdehyde/2-hydroxymuconate-6-semialdehyde dehydrogenase
MDLIYNYINGQLVEPKSKSYLDNFEPATGKVYSKIPDSDEEDVLIAIESARLAFAEWSSTSPKDRADVLYKIALLIKNNHEKLAEIESRDNGKPYKLAYQVDIPRASQNFEFYAGALLHKHDSAYHTDINTFNSMIDYVIDSGPIDEEYCPIYEPRYY